MSQKKRLPIGIQTFREIRENNYYYVDKTQMALDLINEAKHFFLSRPRRFGKSLFLDTLKELFEGNEALFTHLAIHKQWDWSVQYPVIRFSFGGTVKDNEAHVKFSFFTGVSKFAKVSIFSGLNNLTDIRLPRLK